MTYCKYAGIGSRKIDLENFKLCTEIAKQLSDKGFILSTGGALGSDSAFIKGSSKTELWLPFQGYNGFNSDLPEVTHKHLNFTKKYHPAWNKCSPIAKKMHARNAQILLGDNLDRTVDFVVCWTPNGKMVGGTAQGLRIAIDYDIPIFNLGLKSDVTRFNNFIKTF